MDQRNCRDCGVEFTPHHGRHVYCAEHGTRRAAKLREYVLITCVTCGSPHRSSRASGKYCSLFCRNYDRWGPLSCPWPRPAKREPKPKPPPFREERECRWCGDPFTTSVRTQVYCTKNHKQKAIRNRRRGREYGSTSHYTWAEVIRLFLSFDRCCAYCDQRVEGQPDPDHVVPLSRGGSNSITNILPSCRPCNSDKRDLLLDEWAADRERRGLESRRTNWLNDPRAMHLTSVAA